jgi:hypothetical protein
LYLQGLDSNIVAKLLGLSVKAQTRLLEDSKAHQPGTAAACSTGQQQPHQPSAADQASQAGVQPPQQQQQQQQVATSILEPCDVRVTMKSSEAVQDINVDVSALQLRMSPDVLQLLLHLQQVNARETTAHASDGSQLERRGAVLNLSWCCCALFDLLTRF